MVTSALEIDFWRWLCCSPAEHGSGQFMHRQRIPEVFVFKGATLQAWYGTSAKGYVVRRTFDRGDSGLIDRMKDCLLGAEVSPALGCDHPTAGDRPVALLRRACSAPGIEDIPPSAAEMLAGAGVHHASLLTARALTEMLSRLRRCSADVSTPPTEDFALWGSWSLQRLVGVAEDIRAVSVYSCDVMGLEKSDVFGRRFTSLYQSTEKAVVPAAEAVVEVARGIDIEGPVRDSFEVKTLSVVRFASRFHQADFEGLVLEFVLDNEQRPVLHGCWCAAMFHPDEARRKPSNELLAKAQYERAHGRRRHVTPVDQAAHKRKAAVKAWPVPVAGPNLPAERSLLLSEESCAGVSLEATAGEKPSKENWAGDCHADVVTADIAALEAELSDFDLSGGVPFADKFGVALGAGGGACGGAIAGKAPPGPKPAAANQPIWLLELWSGDKFMGEALLPELPKVMSYSEYGDMPSHDLRFQARAGPFSRPDGRKVSSMADGCQVLLLHAGAALVPDQDGQRVLRFGPARAVLERPDALQQPPRLLLWRCQLSPEPGEAPSFSPVWASREAALGGQPMWDETVVLPLQTGQRALPEAGPPASKRRGANSRPQSAKGRLEGSNSVTRSTCGADPGRHFRSAQLSDYNPRSRSHSRRPSAAQAVALENHVPSPHTHVCGAQLLAHWGMAGHSLAADGGEDDEEESAMLTHLLAGQVVTRLSHARAGRSEMLYRLALQLQGFHGLQHAWEEHKLSAEATIVRANEEIQRREQEIARVQREAQQTVDDNHRRLAETCRNMCATIDGHRLREYEDSERLKMSRTRLDEQRNMVHKLVDKNHSLQDSMDKTMEQFDDVQSSLRQTQEEFSQAQLGLCKSAAGAAPPARCSCGNVFMPDSLYCRQCGEKRDDTSELTSAERKIRVAAGDLDQERQALHAVKGQSAHLQAELAAEREHTLKLEAFVRRIANAPSSTVRTGGGFAIDSTAKREAAALLKAAHSGDPLPPPIYPVVPQDWMEAVDDGPLSPQEMTSEIMYAADRMGRNGQLALSELQAFLGAGTEANRRFGTFLDWLTADRSRRFRQCDRDHDGMISIGELHGAVEAFLAEKAELQMTRFHV
eukprot:TRINITY_DN16477_c0_g1_i1.p1 TRINITY_DN16477_c0_g1~~TRINITY_DN16477_c0_g1_i1.p1  ORF type:complete len:1102 (+),score=238.20 TRINITY_DN16477_c0_g1_i1:137-3442(+)